jgi:hypothetical protein
MYREVSRPSIPPERFLKASLLMACTRCVASGCFCEHLYRSLLFSRIPGPELGRAELRPFRFQPQSGAIASERLGGRVFPCGGDGGAEIKLTNDQHFTVDAALIGAWPYLKSFKGRNAGPGEPPDNPARIVECQTAASDLSSGRAQTTLSSRCSSISPRRRDLTHQSCRHCRRCFTRTLRLAMNARINGNGAHRLLVQWLRSVRFNTYEPVSACELTRRSYSKGGSVEWPTMECFSYNAIVTASVESTESWWTECRAVAKVSGDDVDVLAPRACRYSLPMATSCSRLSRLCVVALEQAG